MISADLLEILRCPMDPRRQSRLVEEGDRLVCHGCGMKYKIKDGFPVLVAEEAELPPGVESLEQVPARHAAGPSDG
ncbi:MAG: hypothetical protein K2R98_18205 [Gemmataceae bacterium]|nr:hypothetical protein [Gemmataceae bacterium]